MTAEVPVYQLIMEGSPRERAARAEVRRVFGRDPDVVLGVDCLSEGWRERAMPVRADRVAMLPPGNVCCSTGHAMMLIRLLASGARWGILLEDDVELLATAGEMVRAVEALPAGWDWVNFVNQSGEVVPAADGEQHGQLVRVVRSAWSTAAWAVSHEGACFLLSDMVPQYTQVDAVKRFRANCRTVYQAVPGMARAGSMPSLIHRDVMHGPTGIFRDGAKNQEDAVLAEELTQVLTGRVMDLGCGSGYMVRRLRAAGCEVLGVEGNRHSAAARTGLAVVFDLTRPLGITGYDWALSLEVGEHIPEEHRQTFLDNVCAAAPRVILSWAVPGQQGIGHVNCRTNAEVTGWMRARGFRRLTALEQRLRRVATLEWFRRTLMVYERVE